MTENPNQQALAAVDEVNEGIGTECYGQVRASLAALGVIRKALQSAAQEVDDWVAVEAWSVEYKNRTYALTHLPMADDEHKAYCMTLTGRLLVDHFEAGTRLAALSKAAEFCRKELSK